MSWAAGISSAASIAGSALGAWSQGQANAANAAMAREQMDFQRKMRNTQYQAAVKDLRKAGLNPMLAYTQGGNAAPSGAMATAEPVFGSGGFSSAVDAYQTIIQAEKTRAEIDNVKAQTRITDAEAQWAEDFFLARRNEAAGRASEVGTRASKAIFDRDNGAWDYGIRKLKADVDYTRASATNINAQNAAVKMFLDSPDPMIRYLGAGLQLIFK